MIYVIADDLTGANDTGVQFAKQGYNTQVVIISETNSRSLPNSRSLTENIDVLVIDTETRDTDASTARTRIRHVLEDLNPANEDIIYKKIDSTLRGNIGAELDECLRILKKDFCIFTPSFPQNNRVTIGGCLLVDAQPLGFTEYYSGDLKPDEASFIPTFLGQDTHIPIAQIDIKDVIPGKVTIVKKLCELSQIGKKILVTDAIDDKQLQDILASSFEFDGSVLYCGSAGLANALAEIYCEGKYAKVDMNSPPLVGKFRGGGITPVLIVSGSRRTIVQRQTEYLKSKINILELNIDIERILTERKKYLVQCGTEVAQAIQDGRHVVIQPDPLYHHDEQTQQEILSKYTRDFRGVELAIRGFLGELAAIIIDNNPVRNIILTGGDTAIGVCSAMQIYNLNIINELLPGIPLSVVTFKDNIDLNIVTKAGGFGEEDALYILVEKLVRVHSCDSGAN